MINRRMFERVLDFTALAGGAFWLALTLAGVLSWSGTGWTIGLFTGWLARHLLD